jgi:hypothetical protein
MVLPTMAKSDKQMSKQPDQASESVGLRHLEAVIARAEAACERYRQIADRKEIPPSFRLERRRRTLRTMEAVLARLRAQRDEVAS